jgi:hypothetical protein
MERGRLSSHTRGQMTAGVTALAGVEVNRASILVAAHLFGLLPLCLLRSFSALSFASFLGIGGCAPFSCSTVSPTPLSTCKPPNFECWRWPRRRLLFTGAFMLIRLFDGTYRPGGAFHSALVAAGGKATIVSSFNAVTSCARLFRPFGLRRFSTLQGETQPGD